MPLKAKISLSVLSFALIVLALIYSPKTLYINQTQDTSHDLALRMTLKSASESSNADFALIRLNEVEENETLETLAVKLFKSHQIGKNHQGRGLLILHSLKDKKVKLEVSYALEGVITDLLTHRLQQAGASYLTSNKPSDFFSELILTLTHVLKKEIIVPSDGPLFSESQLSGGGGGIGSLLPENVLELVKKVPTDKRFSPSSHPEESMRSYILSLEEGVGDPTLALLTEGSKIFRTLIPRSLWQLKRMAQYYREAGRPVLFLKENKALAAYGPDSSNLPLYLVKEKTNLWMVDEVKMWNYFHRYEDSPYFHIFSDDTPFREELLSKQWPTSRCTIYKKRLQVPKTSFDQKPKTDEEWGDWYVFELGWGTKAQEHYQRVPDSLAVKWKLYHTLMNQSLMEDALEVLGEIYEARSEDDKELHQWFTMYSIQYAKAQADTAPNIFPWFFYQSKIIFYHVKKMWGDNVTYRNVTDPCLR